MDDRVRVFGEIISDQTRLSIVETLGNEGPLRWIEIMNSLESQYGKINPNKLRFHLNFMLKREAILKETEHEGSRGVKYFRISDWMKELLERISGKEVLSTEKIQKRTVETKVKEQHVNAPRETMNEVKKSFEIGPPSEEGLWELKIDPEFSRIFDSNILDTIEPERDEALEEAIRISGYVEPILIWNGTIIDGHRRYKICKDNNIPFRTREVNFEDRMEAKIFILTHQVAERNLASTTIFELKEKLKGIRNHKKIDSDSIVPHDLMMNMQKELAKERKK